MLILVANPGSSSRKYALYSGDEVLAQLHFELTDGQVQCHLETADGRRDIPTDLEQVTDAASRLDTILHEQNLLPNDRRIDAIGLRIVAPSTHFMQDHLIDLDPFG